MLVDGWFEVRITGNDGDAWYDWLTWQEEGTDWRRLSATDGFKLGTLPPPLPPSLSVKVKEPPKKKAKGARPALSAELKAERNAEKAAEKANREQEARERRVVARLGL